MMRATVLAVLLALAVLVGASPATAADHRVMTTVTDSGQRGIDDLRKCLATADSLQVYLLVDSSGSMADTDPGNIRSTLLGNSLLQLAAIRDDISVEYAMGFFSNDFMPAIGWTPLSGAVEAESARVTQVIAGQPASGGTNWSAAISGAQAALLAQRAPGSCQTMLWLTDGGISVGQNTRAENATAINQLCGNAVAAGGEGPAEGSHGLFNELRQAGTVLFGIMLRDPNVIDDQAEYVPFMKPLVEGEGSVDDSTVTCGEHPIPERFSHGVYLEATSADDLGAVFLQLGALVGGGAQSGISDDGTFPVDPGIARFAILAPGSTWTLAKPSGQTITATSAAAEGFKTETGGSVTKITSPALTPDDIGDWRLEGAPGSTLYYYSDLRLVIEPPATMLAGSDNEVLGRVVGADGEARSLEDFDFDFTLSTVTSSGVEEVPLDDYEVDAEQGTFTLHYSADNASGILTLQAALTDMTTKVSNLPVADVAAEVTVNVTVPENYPTVIPSMVTLSTLEGSGGSATGAFTLTAPADGTAGRVCFPDGSVAVIDSDAADRSMTWDWSYNLAESCTDLAPNESVEVTLAAKNSVPANSSVAAHLNAEYSAANGDVITGSIPIAFTSERPVNLGTFTSLLILLIVLGIALPLAIFQLINWWSTRVNAGAHLLRLSTPVKVHADGSITTVEGQPISEADWGLNRWTFHPRTPNSRTIVDPDLGTIRARVSLNLLGAPWYELVPREAFRVFGNAAYLPRRMQARQARGEILGVRGDLGHLWAVRVGSGASATVGEPVDGTLVAYLRNPTGDDAAYQARITALAQEAKRNLRLQSLWEPRAAQRPVSGRGVLEKPTASRPAPVDEPPRRDRSSDASRATSQPPRRTGDGAGLADSPRRSTPSSPTEPPSRPPGADRPGDSSEPPRRPR